MFSQATVDTLIATDGFGDEHTIEAHNTIIKTKPNLQTGAITELPGVPNFRTSTGLPVQHLGNGSYLINGNILATGPDPNAQDQA